MKKIFVCICILLLTNCVQASPWNPSDEIKALRAVKNAKVSVINNRIKYHKNIIEETMGNASLNESEKQEIYKKEQNELLDLYQQKTNIEPNIK